MSSWSSAPTRWRFTARRDSPEISIILVRPTEANGRRVLSAIADFGFPIAPLTAADIAGGCKVIEMGVAPVENHVMSQIDGVTWDDVWASREVGPFGPRSVAFIGREAFLRNKRAAGRPKDLADVDALREPEGP